MLDVLWLERFTKQRIVSKKNHAHGEIIARAPVRVDFASLLGRYGMRGAGANAARLSCIHISECCFHAPPIRHLRLRQARASCAALRSLLKATPSHASPNVLQFR